METSMANTNEIQKRMKSIKDTMKITNAMYMISSTKLQKAKKKLADTEPYFYTLQQAFQRILRHTPDLESIYFRDTEHIPVSEKKVGYIVVTADKGLAGAYNHNIFKIAHSLFEQGGKNSLFVLGELGRQYFAREGLRVHKHFKYTVQDPSLHRARMITDDIVERYQRGELDEVYILYTRMENAVTAEAEMRKLLPLEKDKFAAKLPVDVYQETLTPQPSWEKILNHLVPNYVNGFIYGALVESYASEHNARMMAMQSATDSARQILAQLSIEYNRVRQAAITQEITEVISGAKAQKRKK